MKAFLIAAALVAGCGDDTQPTIDLTGMEMHPGTVIVAVGKSTRIIAELKASNGQLFDVSNTATWSSSDATIATAATGGLITGVAPGMTTISASRDGQTGSAMVMVLAHDIVSIKVTPMSLTIAPGGTGQLTATATLTDMSMSDITQTATWTSNNLAAVTVAKGTVTGVAAGHATVTAAAQAIMSNGVGVGVGMPPPDGPDIDAPIVDAGTD
jgi:uncharacterized protein YjdB